MFTRKAGAYTSEAPSRCSILGQALDFLAKFRLGWKGLLGPNILAYYKHS